MSEIKQAKERLAKLLAKPDILSSFDIHNYFEEFESLLRDTKLLAKEKMLGDVTLLMTLAEQKSIDGNN